MQYEHIAVPAAGRRISVNPGLSLNVPDQPIIPFIEGDGIGIDVTPAMQRVVDAAVAKAYGSRRRIALDGGLLGREGQPALRHWFPDETLHALREFVVSIKGPLGTPVGGGMRSLNVAMRQNLDLYACVRPIRYFPGVASPMQDASLTDMVVFRENTEDIYAGIEWPAGSAEVHKLIAFLQQELHVTGIRFPGELRHRHQAGLQGGQPAADPQGDPVRHRARSRLGDAGAQGQHHEVHRRAPSATGATSWRRRSSARSRSAAGPWLSFTNPLTGNDIVVKDVIADNFLQQVLLRPEEYDVIATLNLNGDYVSDALAAQVGGIGIAPGGNIGDGLAVFEATHGTAPGLCRQGPRQPRLADPLGGDDAALPEVARGGGPHHQGRDAHHRQQGTDLRPGAPARGDQDAQARARRAQNVEEDLQRLIPGATLMSSSGFAGAVIRHMDD